MGHCGLKRNETKTKTTHMEKKLFNLSLRVLIYQEDGLFHARCLDMDLLGTGDSEKQAVSQLQEMIQEHISFAVFKNDDGLLSFPAEQQYFNRWETAHQTKIRNELFPDRAVKLTSKAEFILFSKEELEKLKKPHRFNLVKGPTLATA